MSRVIQNLSFVLHRVLKRRLFNPYSYFKSFKYRCSRTFISRQKFTRTAGLFASITLAVLTTLAINPIVIKTDYAEGATNDGDSTTLLTIASGESADLELTAAKATGTFKAAADADMATFTVTTNNFTGYTLKLSGDESTLTDTQTSASIDSLTAATDATTFETGSADTYSNKWGYQVNLLNTSSSSYEALNDGNYLPAPVIASPDDKEIALNTTGDANGSIKHPDTEDTYGIRLGARIDYTKPTGTYTNTFTIAAVANQVSYTISYVDETGEATGAPINPAVTTTGQTAVGDSAINATIYDDGVPERTGYTFAGWCDGEVTNVTSGDSTCAGTVYQKGADFLINRTLNNTDIRLYAMWNVESYDQTIRVRYQDATGAYGSYSTYAACTTSKAYGTKHSCTIPADATYQGASLAEYEVTGESTHDITIDRNTNTVSLTKGDGIDTVTVTGTGVKSGSGTASATVYYGGAITIAAKLTSGYEWVNWTGSATYANQSQSISNVTSNLSFKANGKSSVTGMQAFTKAMCQEQASSTGVQVTDTRDNNQYYVRYINGNCWMVQNLRYMGDTVGSTSTTSTWYLKSATSNVSADTTMSMTDLTSGNTYDAARFHNSGNTTNGVWYNYAAASAMTITGSSNTGTQTYDICPKNWRLPTNSEQSGITSYKDAFFNGGAAVTGGRYYNGSINNTGYGFWWSATSYNSTYRYGLRYDGSSLGTSGYDRRYGLYVRCIRSS